MTSTQSNHTEDSLLRLKDFRFFCHLVAYAIAADHFRFSSEERLQEEADCIHRIAGEI